MLLLEGVNITQIRGAASPPLHIKVQLALLGGAYFGQIFVLKTQAKIQKLHSSAEL